ncbi:recombination protein O N-terminal domain-containing protein [Coprothermobacter proteolyticus]|uniref:recombination protein O N-terminal domain-containing protein n=1 Tax=Coprothermobacter proteolyticus TaxID=35786 RepID=UPI001F45F4E5|nr:recombination protein O N-terminal domain-containing protein [Coprothermobacter proteolyticus]
MREIEEQFAILERIPYRETDLLLSVLGEHIGKELLTVRSGRKIPNRWKSSFLEGSILLGRILRVKNHHVLTGVITEKFVPYEKYSPFMILALEMFSKTPSVDRSSFQLLEKFLTSEQTARDFDQFLVSFMVKESLQPSLNSCVVCGEKREQFPISASVYLGGYVCPRCGSGDVELTDVDYESLLKTYRKVGELTENMRAYWLDVLESQLSTKFVSREGLK